MAPSPVRSFWATLSEIPIATLSALAAVAGSFVLAKYFEEVGYRPADLGALFGLGVAITVCLLFAALAVMIAFQAPTIFSGVFETVQLSRLELGLSQCVAVAALVRYILSLDKEVGAGWVFGASLVLAALLMVLISLVDKKTIERGSAWVTAFSAGCGSLLIVVILLWLVPAGAPPQTPAWLVLTGLFLLVALFIWVNAEAATSKGRKQKMWILTAALAFLVIALVSAQGTVPRGVAKVFGLRIGGDSELRVPQATCKTIMSAVQLALQDTVIAKMERDAGDTCREMGNRVVAQVEVRLGTRWLVRVRSINGMKVDEKSPRVTIPDLGTELLVFGG